MRRWICTRCREILDTSWRLSAEGSTGLVGYGGEPACEALAGWVHSLLTTLDEVYPSGHDQTLWNHGRRRKGMLSGQQLKKVMASVTWVALVLMSCSRLVRASLTNQDLERINHFIEHLRQCKDTPGLSVAIVQDGRTVLLRGFGVADLETGVQTTEDTLFCIASCTKAFTVAMLGQVLYSRGYTWDTRVSEILGDRVRFPDDHRTRHVTIRDLLLHRTGFPRYDYLWAANVFTSQEIFRRVACMQEAKEFRTATIYNNIMYSLAGHVAETMEGRSWDDLLVDLLLKPLGMDGTTTLSRIRNMLVRDSGEMTNIAAPYALHPERGPLRYSRDSFLGAEHISPAIAIYSSGRDMAKWLQFLLGNGTLEDGTVILNHTVMTSMFTPQEVATSDPQMYTPILERPQSQVTHAYDRYALGWFVGHYRGLPSLMHFGSSMGHYSMVELLPSRGIGIFTAINGGHQSYSYSISTLIHTYILDIAERGQSWLSPSDACAFEQMHYDVGDLDLPFDRQSMSSSADVLKFKGIYYNHMFGNLSIIVENKKNKLLYGHWKFHMYHNSSGIAYIEPDRAILFLYDKVIFQTKESGDITSVDVPFLERSDVPRFYKYRASVSYRQWREDIDSNCSLSNASSAISSISLLFILLVLNCIMIFGSS